MPVDAAYALRLKSEAAYVSATPTNGVAWTDRAVESETISPIALADDAITEAQRQADFFAGPLAEDRHVVAGRRRDLMLKSVKLFGDRLGYEAGALCFVTGVQENANGTTTLIVLKKLP